jgi:CRISPR-associated protein Csm3
MDQNTYRKLLGRVEIKGTLKCLTGLHIGASKDNMEIGAIDSPVVRDPISLEPYIPGSSLKGKLRTLLEKANPGLLPNRDGGSGTSRHECNDWGNGTSPNKNYKGSTFDYPGALNCPVCRLFGSTGPGEGNRNYPARLRVRDLKLKNAAELKAIDTGLLYTEWKFENSIDRVTSAANPRNLERVPRGARFKLSIIYDVEDAETLENDLDNLRLSLRLLEDDALGGHGSRGYGQVRFKFKKIEAKTIEHYRGQANQTLDISDIEEIGRLVGFFQNGGSPERK